MRAAAASLPDQDGPDLGSRLTLRPAEVEVAPWPDPARPAAGSAQNTDQRRARIAAAAADCLLDRYRARRGCRPPLITERQHEAGLKLRALWDRAERMPATIARYEAMPRARRGSPTAAEDGAASRDGARAALARVLDGLPPKERSLVEAVCRHDEPARSTMGLLRRGLDGVADYWGMPPER